MRVYTLKEHISDKEGYSLRGTYLDDNSYDLLIDHDADGYDENGNLLFRFRKGVLPLETLKLGVDSFKKSIQLTESRGMASGSSHKRIRKDGSVSKITVGNKVTSGNVGYMDPSAMIHYCRKTAFGRRYFDLFQQGIPFVQKIDELYSNLIYDKWRKQKDMAEATNPNYVIGDTSFTTITVNKNFRTAVHKDAGDYAEGFGNLFAYRQGDFEGGYFVLPQYRVAIDLQNTDALFVDVHKWHGNTEFKNCEPDWLRISFVLYYRENMINCESPEKELIRMKLKNNYKKTKR